MIDTGSGNGPEQNGSFPLESDRETDLLEAASLADFMEEVSESRRKVRVFGRVTTVFLLVAVALQAAWVGNWDLLGETMVAAFGILGFCEFVAWRSWRWGKTPGPMDPEP